MEIKLSYQDPPELVEMSSLAPGEVGERYSQVLERTDYYVRMQDVSGLADGRPVNMGGFNKGAGICLRDGHMLSPDALVRRVDAVLHVHNARRR